MDEMDERIVKFIGKHHVMTLATVNEKNEPHCCSLFYVYIKEWNAFAFTTSNNTIHGVHLGLHKRVAANILLETNAIGKIEGLQIEGECESAESLSEVRNAYLKRYPFAVFMTVDLWLLRPTTMKLTDNKLGFGKKIKWSIEEEQ